jgi:hypothetical protein
MKNILYHLKIFEKNLHHRMQRSEFIGGLRMLF